MVISNRNQLNLAVMSNPTDPPLDLKALADPRLILATMSDRRLFSGNHTRPIRLGLSPYMAVNPCPGLTPNMVIRPKDLRSCMVPRLKQLESGMCLPYPRCLGLTTLARPKQTTNKQMIIVHFSCQKIEKKEKTQTIDHRRQSNYDISTHAAPCGRGHIRAFI